MQQGVVAKLFMAALLAGLTDPVGVASLAREVSVRLLFSLLESQRHALEWFITIELHGTPDDHDC